MDLVFSFKSIFHFFTIHKIRGMCKMKFKNYDLWKILLYFCNLYTSCCCCCFCFWLATNPQINIIILNNTKILKSKKYHLLSHIWALITIFPYVRRHLYFILFCLLYDFLWIKIKKKTNDHLFILPIPVGIKMFYNKTSKKKNGKKWKIIILPLSVYTCT